MERMQHIELYSLVAVITGSEELILEGASAHGQSVYSRELRHMTFFFVQQGHALHGEALGVERLDDGVLAVVSVKGTSYKTGVRVYIAYGSRILAVLIAYSQHVSAVAALQLDSCHPESGVAV